VSEPDPRWQVFIDRGGTFTDVIGLAPDGQIHSLKLLSENPTQYADAAIEGIRRLLNLTPDEAITHHRVALVKMGTTVATNALLERTGHRPVLVTTTGFKDALRIGHQSRPALFAQHIELPELLYDQVVEVDERITANGEILTPLAEDRFYQQCLALKANGHQRLAVVFLHAWINPQHEVCAERIARAAGFTDVTLSHRVSPLIKFIGRGDTTLVDAYLSPILNRYVEQVRRALPNVPLRFMQSFGGLTEVAHFQAKDAILSGPAGGIVGMAKTAQAVGFDKVIGFDMGGTSTDVSHYAGQLERVYETTVAGVRLKTPLLNIHTVAAGGSSLIRFDGARLRIGPQSAGANPGPACYRKHGPLTITDAHVQCGRLRPDCFPAVFGPHGNEPLDPTVVADAFQALADSMSTTLGQAIDGVGVAAGALRIAVQQMANAVKKISVARGYNVREYTLQCFGGAGAQLACAVADALHVDRILLHPLAGVLSAYGIGVADDVRVHEVSVEQPFTLAGLRVVHTLRRQLEQDVEHAAPHATDQRKANLVWTHQLRLRYEGTDSAIECPYTADVSDDELWTRLHAAFEQRYQQRFAFLMHDRALTIESLVTECRIPGALQDKPGALATPSQPATPHAHVDFIGLTDDQHHTHHNAPLYHRHHLIHGDVLVGPALLIEAHSTVVIEAGWQAVYSASGHVVLTRHQPRTTRHALGTHVDPIQLEVFNNVFMNIAEQMGLSLQNTAYSVNIKERLDFSCALFDGEGQLIANAPHIPVHLGSMSDSIRAVIEQHPDLKPDDVIVLNDPYQGGTHLPDITVVTGVFVTDPAGKADFYVASRGHHADVGGVTPGSMPAHSRSIHDEGVLIQNVKLLEQGSFNEQRWRDVFESGPYPCRNPDQNRADLRAQIAANQTGVRELKRLVDQVGMATVKAYMRHVQDHAEECVRRAIETLTDGAFTLPLDNGAVIRVAIRVNAAAREAVIDFTGTSDQLNENFNAPRAITTAAVLYVFRSLVKDDIPLNHGCLKPLSIVVPEGSMLNPRPPAAVVAGNVETSSCVTNALYGALGVLASSQCTMNNLTFGNARVQYYETIAGGSGAGPGFNGTAVVQTHMTNSRLTDPEVLERRYPVRVDGFAIKPHSGGLGRWRGGDGGVRRIRFLEAMTVTILSNNRVHGPFGLHGGHAGAVGRNWLERANGQVEALASTAEIDVAPGDTLVIETPGGGGYGSPDEATASE